MQLKIKPLPVPPEKQKLSFRLPLPTIDTYNAYLDAYAKAYGVPADPDFIVNEIFTAFFDSDKEFAAFLKTADVSTEQTKPLKGNKKVRGQQAEETQPV